MGLPGGQALLAAALLVVAGCNTRNPPPPLSSILGLDAASPPDGGEGEDPTVVRMSIDGEPAHLNPNLDPDRWGYRLSHDLIYEPLVRQLPDGSFAPVLADRFTVDPAGDRLLFHLRQGVKFHDDRPLGPFDVQFTLDSLRAAASPAQRLRAQLADVERVEVHGEWVHVYSRPSAHLLGTLAEIDILPQHLFEAGGLAHQAANRRPVGTGPFRLRSWERGKQLVLERFSGHWAAPSRASAIEVAFEPPLRGIGRVKRGEVDVLGGLPPSYLPEQLDSPAIRTGFEAVRVQPARFAFVVWNTHSRPLDDPTVRQALALAVDRSRVLAAARNRIGRPIVGPPMAGLPDPPIPAVDLTAAAAALDRAGLARRADGTRMIAGRPWRLSLLVPTGSRESEEAGKRVAEALARLGIAVDTVAGDLAPILLRLKKGQFDAALLEWFGRPDEDLSPLLRTGGSQNWGAYSSRPTDVLLDALRRPSPPAERSILRERLAAALAADPPALFLYAPEDVFIYRKRLAPAPRTSEFLLLRELAPR